MKFKLFEDVKGNFESEEAFWAALKAGWEVEKEHAVSMDNCPIKVVRIALDHLGEDTEYYTKLKKMEAGDKPKEGEKDAEDSEEEKEEEGDKEEDKGEEAEEVEGEEKGEEGEEGEEDEKDEEVSLKV